MRADDGCELWTDVSGSGPPLDDSLAAALPEARRVVLPGVGHIPWLEAPEPSFAALRGFL